MTAVDPVDDDLVIRPPQQRRSREAWQRVLDAGVALLEDGGYEAFTIAALCARAGVAPPSIYARTTSKDALFLAVYEHGIARLLDDQQVFDDGRRWDGLRPRELVVAGVEETAGIFLRHRRFLRSVVLTSAAHPEVRRRGSVYAEGLGRQFGRVLLGAGAAIQHPDPEAAVRACFGTLFAAAVIRVAYGSDFASPAPVDDEAWLRDLGEQALRYLLGGPVR
jgi:AcrR family transcriptional regulator